MYYSYATLFISFAACVLEPVLAGAKYANALSIVPVSPSPVGPTVITKVNQGGKDGEQQYEQGPGVVQQDGKIRLTNSPETDSTYSTQDQNSDGLVSQEEFIAVW